MIPAVDVHRPWEVLLQDGLDPTMRFFPVRLNLIMLSLMMDAGVSPEVEDVE